MKTKEVPKIALNERVYTTRTLNMNSVKVIGFDMDYTLVVYREKELEDLVFQLTVQYLIDELDYPEAIKTLEFKADQVIRGLVIDKKLGNLIKINRFGYVKAALHGDHFYTWEELRDIYSDEIVTFPDRRYEMIHTLFSLAMSSLFCQITDLDLGDRSYEELYEDLLDAIDHLHRQGPLKRIILDDPGKFVIRDERYAQTLRMMKDFKKTLLLVTNSDWPYTKSIMEYCYDPFLPKGQTWRDLFDLVVVDATKPEFFYGRAPYYEVVNEEGHLLKVTGTIQRGGVYQGGNAVAIEKLFDVPRGQILYIGDHIYSDVYQSKKMCQWRTMLVILELEDELCAAAAADPLLGEIKEHMSQKEMLELKLDAIKRRICSSGGGKTNPDLEKEEEQTRERMRDIDRRVGDLIVELDSHFNPLWGELLYAGNDKSYFFMSIERYACTYTSKVSNLLHYSPVHYFRPPMKSYETA
jgi:5'-nucleotidase